MDFYKFWGCPSCFSSLLRSIIGKNVQLLYITPFRLIFKVLECIVVLALTKVERLVLQNSKTPVVRVKPETKNVSCHYLWNNWMWHSHICKWERSVSGITFWGLLPVFDSTCFHSRPSNQSLLQRKFWADMLISRFFSDKNILLLALYLQYVKGIFLWTAIVMVTVYIKSLIHFPLKSLERLIQLLLPVLSYTATWSNTFWRDFEKCILAFPLKTNFVMDEICEGNGFLLPHNN